MTASNSRSAGDQWLLRLKAAVEAGYYRTEGAETSQVSFPWQSKACGDCPFWRNNYCMVRLEPRCISDHTCTYFDPANRPAAELILARRKHPGHWWEDFFANHRGHGDQT